LRVPGRAGTSGSLTGREPAAVLVSLAAYAGSSQGAGGFGSLSAGPAGSEGRLGGCFSFVAFLMFLVRLGSASINNPAAEGEVFAGGGGGQGALEFGDLFAVGAALLGELLLQCPHQVAGRHVGVAVAVLAHGVGAR
jgi:hypothetical protein